MIQSMTAFARSERDTPAGRLTWEIRSVNNRFLDVSLRMPEELRAIENEAREAIRNAAQRGKVECFLRWIPQAAAAVEIDEVRVIAIADAARKVGHHLDNAARIDPMEVLTMPGVIVAQEQDVEQLRTEALASLEDALKDLVQTRAREGERLADLLRERCDALEPLVGEARVAMPRVMHDQRARFKERLSEILHEVDEGRLEQELAIQAQRLDIDEEMDRLMTHITEVRRVLKKGGAVGRRLDFLMQELHREANTLGSKSSDLETTRISVEMKVLIEQMREQVQNIE